MKVHGVFWDKIPGTCDHPQFVSIIYLTDMAGHQLTFYNPKGEVIGTATTGGVDLTDTGDGCRGSTPYQVILPKEEFYQMQVPGRLLKFTISLGDLERSNFEWNVPN